MSRTLTLFIPEPSVVKMCDKDVVVNGKVVMEAEPLQLKRNIGLVSGVAYIAGMIIGDDVISTPFSLTSRAPPPPPPPTSATPTTCFCESVISLTVQMPIHAFLLTYILLLRKSLSTARTIIEIICVVL